MTTQKWRKSSDTKLCPSCPIIRRHYARKFLILHFCRV